MNIETVGDAINAAEAELNGQADAGGGAEVSNTAIPDAGAEAAPPVDLTPLEPHKDWTKEMVEAFKEMQGHPEKGRTWAERSLNQYNHLDKRFRDMQSQHDRYGSFVSQFQSAVGPYIQRYHMEGLTPVQGIQRALAWEAQLANNPEEGLRRLAQTLGVDLAKLTDQSNETWVDPAVKQMQQVYDQRINGLESQLSGFQSFAQQQRQNELLAHIQAFASQKDASGQPVAPYFQDILDDESLTQQLGTLVRNGYDLQTAYRMVEHIAEPIQAKLKAAAAEKAKQEAAARLQQTTKAEAVSAVTKAPAGKGAPAKKAVMSFDEAFAEAKKAQK